MAFAPLALGILGAVTSTVGLVSAGEAASSQARYQAQVARNNAIIAEQNATFATESGEQQATESGLKGAANIGHIKTAQAASGLDVNSGSPVSVRSGQSAANLLDTQTVMHNALLKAYGYQTQATGFTSQAGLDTAASENDTIGAGFGAAGSLLSDASSLGFKYSGSQNPGALNTPLPSEDWSSLTIK